MNISERVELVAGVCVLIYHENDPKIVLMTQELKAKELTGKLANQWGLGYETVKRINGSSETHLETIQRCISANGEEVKVIRDGMHISESLEDSKLCIVRISPPAMGAWVHAYSVAVSDDFEVGRGRFKKEMGEAVWVNYEDVLDMIQQERARNGLSIFRPGTFEILTKHLQRQGGDFEPGIFPDPINLPPWEVYQIMARRGKRRFSQSEALSQLGVDPQPLEDSLASVHSLSARLQKITTPLSPQFSHSFLQ